MSRFRIDYMAEPQKKIMYRLADNLERFVTTVIVLDFLTTLCKNRLVKLLTQNYGGMS